MLNDVIIKRNADSDSVGRGWGSKFCNFNKFLDDGTAKLWITRKEITCWKLDRNIEGKLGKLKLMIEHIPSVLFKQYITPNQSPSLYNIFDTQVSEIEACLRVSDAVVRFQ